MRTKIIIDKRRKNKGGYPVKIYLKFKNKPIYILTNVEVEENEFLDGEIINRKDAKILNNILANKKTSLDHILFDLENRRELYKFTPKTLKLELEGKTPSEEEKEKVVLFKPYFVAYGNKLKSKNTYSDALIKIEKYADTEILQFSDINRAWLKEFELQMQNDGLSVNTIGIYLRNIRTVFNDAINNELIDFGIYPFRRFKIKTEETMHRTMTVEQLISLRDYECTEGQARYRDLFMLSFYLRGLNLIDIVHLKKTDLHNGIISSKRNKTNVPYEIKVEPEAQSIIDKYRGKKYLINAMDNRKTYENFRNRLDKMLKLIGIEMDGKEIIKQPFSYLSIYWARHTWATIAAELDIPDKIISIGLQQKQKQSIVDTYIKRNLNKVHDANRKVLDFLKNDEPPTPSE